MEKYSSNAMTIGRLAQMSQKEFFGIGEGFDKVDKRFDKVDENIGILRKDMEVGFGALGEILKEIRTDVKDVKSDVLTVNEDYREIRARVERLEKKVGLPR